MRMIIAKKYFQNKVVWVTGASSGVGKALVHVLAAQGASVVLSSRDAEQLKNVKNESGLSDDKSLILPFDQSALTQTHSKELVKSVLEKFKKLDVVFLNAGVSQRYKVQETERLDIDRKILETNFLGVVQLTKTILPYFIQQKSGQFVVTSSVCGKIGLPFASMYCASKHALHGYFDALRTEVDHNNIAVTLVVLGFIATQASNNALLSSGAPHQHEEAYRKTRSLDPMICANKMLRAARKKKKEVRIGGAELLGVHLKRWLPSLLHVCLSKIANSKKLFDKGSEKPHE